MRQQASPREQSWRRNAPLTVIVALHASGRASTGSEPKGVTGSVNHTQTNLGRPPAQEFVPVTVPTWLLVAKVAGSERAMIKRLRCSNHMRTLRSAGRLYVPDLWLARGREP